MNAQQLLQEISDYCRQTGLAESTFGRRAVNDGKLAARLRNGGRITTDTLDRIHGFMAANPAQEPAPCASSSAHENARPPCQYRRLPCRPPRRSRTTRSAISASSTTGKNICCSSTPAARNGRSRTASPKNLRTCIRVRRRCAVFDAGVGDGSVLVRVMRAMHDRFPNMPFYTVGKEISLEDVRLTLQKMSDRFFEHPASVLVLTNLAYADAPWLR